MREGCLQTRLRETRGIRTRDEHSYKEDPSQDGSVDPTGERVVYARIRGLESLGLGRTRIGVWEMCRVEKSE